MSPQLLQVVESIDMGCKITMLTVEIKGKHKHFSKELKDLKKNKQILYSRFEKEASTNSTLKMQLLKLRTRQPNITGNEIQLKRTLATGKQMRRTIKNEAQKDKGIKTTEERMRQQGYLEDLICLIVKTTENATYMNKYKVTRTE